MFQIDIKWFFFNHRAKRGGSLSGVGFGGRREGCARSRVFPDKVVPYVGKIGRNSEGREFWPSRRGWHFFFGFGHQGAELLGAKGEKMGVFALND